MVINLITTDHFTLIENTGELFGAMFLSLGVIIGRPQLALVLLAVALGADAVLLGKHLLVVYELSESCFAKVRAL